MTKTEELRERIARDLYNDGKDYDAGSIGSWEQCYLKRKGYYYQRANQILKLLADMGCGFKVEGELPDIENYCQLIQGFSDYSGRMSGYRTAQQDMLSADFVGFELIGTE